MLPTFFVAKINKAPSQRELSAKQTEGVCAEADCVKTPSGTFGTTSLGEGGFWLFC